MVNHVFFIVLKSPFSSIKRAGEIVPQVILQAIEEAMSTPQGRPCCANGAERGIRQWLKSL